MGCANFFNLHTRKGLEAGDAAENVISPQAIVRICLIDLKVLRSESHIMIKVLRTTDAASFARDLH